MIREGRGKYATAESRWAGVGPYYAMFPMSFADAVVAAHSSRGDTVLDPFSGRGTAIYSAAIAGRHGVGIELNPVGWVYASAKLAPAPSDEVCRRITEIAGQS